MNKAMRCGKSIEYVPSQPVYAFRLPQNEPKNEALKFKAKEYFCMARSRTSDVCRFAQFLAFPGQFVSSVWLPMFETLVQSRYQACCLQL